MKDSRSWDANANSNANASIKMRFCLHSTTRCLKMTLYFTKLWRSAFRFSNHNNKTYTIDVYIWSYNKQNTVHLTHTKWKIASKTAIFIAHKLVSINTANGKESIIIYTSLSSLEYEIRRTTKKECFGIFCGYSKVQWNTFIMLNAMQTHQGMAKILESFIKNWPLHDHKKYCH